MIRGARSATPAKSVDLALAITTLPQMDKAMPKDRATQVFLAHAAAYVSVTLICAAVNLWLAPETL